MLFNHNNSHNDEPEYYCIDSSTSLAVFQTMYNDAVIPFFSCSFSSLNHSISKVSHSILFFIAVPYGLCIIHSLSATQVRRMTKIVYLPLAYLLPAYLLPCKLLMQQILYN